VVIGSEGEGVHRLVRERCDARVRLPVKGHIASLNASAAASALLYEVIRQRDSHS
jgi:23S rRNA (guanosine2251-2'-O)-methyltransferase